MKIANALYNMFLDLFFVVIGVIFLSGIDTYYPKIGDLLSGGLWALIVCNRTWLRWRKEA